MASTLEMPETVAEEIVPHRWTYDEYVRIHETGVFGDAHTELIEGRIYVKMPQGNAHIIAVQLVFWALHSALGEGANLAMGLPMKMDQDSSEPDVRVLRGAIRDYDGREIDAANDVFLAVEVSDSTLKFDRNTKVRLYARHGIPEYWIVNLRERTLEVRRGPNPEHGEYAETRVLREGESIEVGGGTVAVAGLLPKSG